MVRRVCAINELTNVAVPWQRYWRSRRSWGGRRTQTMRALVALLTLAGGRASAPSSTHGRCSRRCSRPQRTHGFRYAAYHMQVLPHLCQDCAQVWHRMPRRCDVRYSHLAPLRHGHVHRDACQTAWPSTGTVSLAWKQTMGRAFPPPAGICACLQWATSVRELPCRVPSRSARLKARWLKPARSWSSLGCAWTSRSR